MPIDRGKFESSSLHFFAKGVGVLPCCLADEAITPARMHVGSNLPSNTFIEGDQAFISRI